MRSSLIKIERGLKRRNRKTGLQLVGGSRSSPCHLYFYSESEVCVVWFLDSYSTLSTKILTPAPSVTPTRAKRSLKLPTPIPPRIQNL